MNFKYLQEYINNKIFFLVISLTLMVNYSGKAQIILEDSRNDYVYDFLEEMALNKLIDYNSAVKPISHFQIYSFLKEIKENMSKLNSRQSNELEYFIEKFKYDFESSKDTLSILTSSKIRFGYINKINKPINLFSYKDSIIRFSINPIIGYDYYANKNYSVYHRWNGAGAYGTLGKHLGLYVSLRDNHESQVMAKDSFLVQKTGASYKSWDLGRNRFSGVDYSQVFAGVTYSWNWGYFGILYDHFQWGSNYNGSNIFSGRTPAFAQIYLKLKPVSWFELNYVHAWLNSNVIDSAASYSIPPIFGYSTREVFRQKFLAANFITFQPFKKLYLSVGNSIVYSDIGVHPAYLIPIMFYNSADQDIGSNNNFAGQNSQFYIDISSKQIKKLHLFTSLFVDELSFSRMWDKNQQSNYISFKTGFNLSNISNSNLSIIGEYTRTNPQVYKHVIPTTTFASNNYNLGHYLGDNSDEIFLMVQYKPIERLNFMIKFDNIRKGIEYDLLNGTSRWGFPFMEKVEFYRNSLSLIIRYLMYNDVTIKFDCTYSKSGGNTSRYEAGLYDGKILTNSISIYWGI